MQLRPNSLALRICSLYCLMAGGWILLSDKILAWFIPDPTELSRLQTYKGWVFVILTALLLYWVLTRWLWEWEAAQARKISARNPTAAPSENAPDEFKSHPNAPDSIERQLRRTVNAGTLVALLVMGFIGYSAWRTARQATTNAQWISHTHQTLQNVADCLSYVVDVESGARVYVISANPELLEPQNRALAGIEGKLKQIRLLAADNPEQLRRLNVLEPQVAAKLEFMKRVMTTRDSEGAAAATRLIESGQGKLLMDEVRATVKAMRQAEEILLQQREAAFARLDHRAAAVSLEGSLAGIIFMVLAWWILNREVRAEGRARAEVRALNTELEQRVTQRTAQLTEVNQALRTSEERYRTTLDNMLEACQLIGFDWRYLYLNHAAAISNRRANADLLGRTMPESYPGIETTKVFALLRRCMEERIALHDEIEFVFPDGSKGWFDVRSQPVPEGIFVLSVDITERKEHERELERLTRLYAALSQVNQAIVHTNSRAELFREVCRVLVEFGGFRMAWIGWHDPENRQLVPVAEWGDENNYVQNIKVFTDERPEARGPSGTAFRLEQPQICNDMLNDASLQPWRAAFEPRGYRAGAFFPIRLQGVVSGTLNIYATELGFFQSKEIALLDEAAGDVSFALDNFAREEERQRAEAVAQREKHFSDAMIESMPGIVYFYNAQGQFLRWNRNFEIVSGYSAAEIAQMHPSDFFSPAEKPLLKERIAEVFTKGESSVEAAFVAKTGRATPYFFTGKRLTFDGAACLVGVGVDIAERKYAEQKVSTSRDQLRALLARLQQAQEEERTRVAREIHDELGQLLTGLKMDVRWLEKKLSAPGLPPELNPLLDRAVAASALADTTIATVQKIAAELRPGALDKLGLAAALTQRARRFAERSGIHCTVTATEAELPPAVATELFYIAQEALTNVARHAHAKNVTIRLATESGATVLEVCDDGVGLSEADVDAGRALGLLGMKERVGHCAGTIVFQRLASGGTQIIVRIPKAETITPGEIRP